MYKSGNPMTLDKAASAITRARFVTIASGLVEQANAATDVLYGVANDDTSATDTVAGVQLIDGASVVEVEAGAAVTLGSEVTADAQGRAVDAATGNQVGGIALSATAAAGEMVNVLLTRLSATAP